MIFSRADLEHIEADTLREGFLKTDGAGNYFSLREIKDETLFS